MPSLPYFCCQLNVSLKSKAADLRFCYYLRCVCRGGGGGYAEQKIAAWPQNRKCAPFIRLFNIYAKVGFFIFIFLFSFLCFYLVAFILFYFCCVFVFVIYSFFFCWCCCCFCFEFKLLTLQPCWFTLHQRKTEEGLLVMHFIHSSLILAVFMMSLLSTLWSCFRNFRLLIFNKMDKKPSEK